MELDIFFKVYIIESPSSEDLLIDRREGTSLSSIFKLENILYEYYLVIDKNAFIQAINLIKEDMIELQYEDMRESQIFPIIHLSCHGDDECISLSSGECVCWDDLNKIINEQNLNLVFEEVGINSLTLSMSSCYGLYAIYADKDVKGKSPFAYILGHEDEIRWDDSLIAFATFYHNLINKNLTFVDSVKCMNNSINSPDFFKLFHSYDTYNLFTKPE